MIRINLLGQARPKATKQAVPLESTVQLVFLLVALVVAGAVLGITYYQQKGELDRTNAKISQLRAEKASLQQVKADVDKFESEKAVLQQRIDVIEELQRNRTGGQELLTSVANTVVHVDQLWLTSLNRTGNNLDIGGEAVSINAVANFITQMKRTGYFDKVEIKTAKENDIRPNVTTFTFAMTAAVSAVPSPDAQAKPVAAGADQLPQPAAKGRS
jgi:Tfp pilus assembly protein PilN